MKFDELAILLTCHTFQDFPVHPTGEDADGLLSAWTALWHPLLIANCGKMPTWHRLDALPAHDQARLLVLPPVEASGYATGLAAPIHAAGGRLIENQPQRAQILAQAFDGWTSAEAVDTELAADFMALGYAYLQIELLTRRMRYATRTAETAFGENVVAAAVAAAAGDVEQARTLLQTCYDFLSQERDHYYAVDVYLIDIALVVETLFGEPLLSELQHSGKLNLTLPACDLATLQQQHPTTWQTLRAGVEEGRVRIVGGEWRELPASLVSTENLERQLSRGLQAYQDQLGLRPKAFGRRTFGLTSCWPQILLRAGFDGALHATFDGGRFPEATQAKSRWEGDGQFSIDAIMRAPVDATRPETFLGLAIKLSEAMDMDHIATRTFVHWAGQASPWYRELQRVARFTRALGRFVTVDEYFQETYDPGIHDRCDPNQYRSEYLEQLVASGHPRPISQWAQYWRRHSARQARLNLAALVALVSPSAATRESYAGARAHYDQFCDNPLSEPASEFEQEAGEESTARTDERANARHLAEVLGATATSSAGLPHGSHPADSGDASGGDDSVTGYAVINSTSFPRRVLLTEIATTPASEAPIYAVDSSSGETRVMVDVPALGISVVRPRANRASSGKTLPPLAENNLLRNEFVEATVDPQTGGLRTLRAYSSRINRISQQLVYRQPTSPYRTLGPGGVPLDSKMQADEITVLTADTTLGSIRSRGRLIGNNNQTLATFVQTMQLQRGSRVVRLQIELEPQVELAADVWDAYFGCRFAWPSEAADISRSLNDIRRPATTKRFEAPLFIELDDGQDRTAILTGGLPFHRRAGARMLDSLLLVRGETARQFELGIGLDLKQPFREAIGFITPTTCVELHQPLGTLTTAWLFHVDTRNVLATGWQPLWDGDRLRGVRSRLIEVEGRSTTVNLRSFRGFLSGRKIDGSGQTVETCEISGDQLTFRASPFEIVEIEALWEAS